MTMISIATIANTPTGIWSNKPVGVTEGVVTGVVTEVVSVGVDTFLIDSNSLRSIGSGVSIKLVSMSGP